MQNFVNFLSSESVHNLGININSHEPVLGKEERPTDARRWMWQLKNIAPYMGVPMNLDEATQLAEQIYDDLAEAYTYPDDDPNWGGYTDWRRVDYDLEDLLGIGVNWEERIAYIWDASDLRFSKLTDTERLRVAIRVLSGNVSDMRGWEFVDFRNED